MSDALSIVSLCAAVPSDVLTSSMCAAVPKVGYSCMCAAVPKVLYSFKGYLSKAMGKGGWCADVSAV